MTNGAYIDIPIRPEDDTRAFNRGLKNGLRDAVGFWRKELAPQHFVRGAEQKYHYKRRSFKYDKRKERRKGHKLPLVYSGNTLHWIQTRFANPTVRKSKGVTTARVPLTVPNYFYKYRGTGPNKVDELLTTSKRESQAMEKIITKGINSEFRALRQQSRSRKRASRRSL